MNLPKDRTVSTTRCVALETLKINIDKDFSSICFKYLRFYVQALSKVRKFKFSFSFRKSFTIFPRISTLIKKKLVMQREITT